VGEREQVQCALLISASKRYRILEPLLVAERVSFLQRQAFLLSLPKSLVFFPRERPLVRYSRRQNVDDECYSVQRTQLLLGGHLGESAGSSLGCNLA